MTTAPKSKIALSLVVDNKAPLRPRQVRPSVTRAAPKPVKAELPALVPEASVAAACHAVMNSCFAHLIDNRMPVLKSEDPEAVHQARVALRRLRAAIAIFRDVVPGEALKQIGEEARWLAGEMGPVRDLDVFLGEIFQPVAKKLAEEAGVSAYRMTAKALQAEARQRARRALRSRRFQHWRNQVQSWLAADIAPPLATAVPSDTAGLLYQPVSEFAAAILDKRDRQARRRSRHLARLPVAERHELRLSLKKLRYAAEFFASAFPQKETARYIKRLARLQDALGYLNDKEVAQPLMVQIEARIAAASSELAADARYVSGLVTGWHEADHEAVERELRQAWKRFDSGGGFWN
ncbi:MAG: adenylate cyclase [Alphaproteobacteria bacterium]|nr:adenylate cyclase [Alphaproteobacteria bacterium]